MAYTSADYLAALPQFKLMKPRGADDLFAKVYCLRCGRLDVHDSLDLEDPELDPAWFLCSDCKPEVEAVMSPEE